MDFKKRKKALITGITGQDGSYLAEFLLEKGYEVHGIVRRSSTVKKERIDHLSKDKNKPFSSSGEPQLHYGDLTDSTSIKKIIKEVMPDEIYNLGAQSHVGISFEIPENTSNITAIGALRILEAMREICPKAKFYQASSSEMFGKVMETPQSEKTIFHPRSPYGCSKVYAYHTTVNYREAYGLHASNGILFNHESERRGENFVTRKITRTLARIKMGLAETLALGNLEAKRDWGYAKDFIEVMWLIMQQDKPDDYVIGTGEMHSVRELLEETAKVIGLKIKSNGKKGIEEEYLDENGRTIVKIDPEYIRPAEVDVLCANPVKAKTKLGWEPKIKFKELVKIMAEHDMKLAQEEAYLSGKENEIGEKISSAIKPLLEFAEKYGIKINHNKKEKKIVLIQPDSPFLLEPLTSPSLGLLYISSYLKRKGYNPEFYDLTGGVKLPENLHADIFGFSCQVTQFLDVKKIKDKLKEKNPNALFVIGGPFPTHSPQECIDDGFDAVVRGEGEIPMLKIVEDFPNIKNKIYFTEEYIDPNEIFPDWDAIDLSRYKSQLKGKKCVNIMTKRGNCPYNCTFCAKQEVGKSSLRFRTVENIIEEITFLKNKFGVGAVAIYDDDVLINKERDKKLFEKLAQLGIPYRCMTRSNLATKEDLQMLKDTGCTEVCVGIESANRYIHDNVIKKGTTLEQDNEFIKNCKEIGLNVKAYLIIGLPNESRQSIEEMKEWLRNMKPDNFDISVFTPYPGSDIYKNKSSYEIDWDEKKLRKIWFFGEPQYEGCAVWTPYLSSEEILKMKNEIKEEFKRGKGGTTNYWGVIKDDI